MSKTTTIDGTAFFFEPAFPFITQQVMDISSPLSEAYIVSANGKELGHVALTERGTWMTAYIHDGLTYHSAHSTRNEGAQALLKDNKEHAI